MLLLMMMMMTNRTVLLPRVPVSPSQSPNPPRTTSSPTRSRRRKKKRKMKKNEEENEEEEREEEKEEEAFSLFCEAIKATQKQHIFIACSNVRTLKYAQRRLLRWCVRFVLFVYSCDPKRWFCCACVFVSRSLARSCRRRFKRASWVYHHH